MNNRAHPGRKASTKTSNSSTLIIGVGNRFRSDDAVGLLIAEELAKHNLPNVTIIQHSGEGASLMEAWQPYQSVIIIDAVSSGAPPGTIHRLDAVASKIPSNFFHYSTHAFSVAEAIELARVTGQLPEKLLLFGIEGKNFKAGERLSTAITKAMATVTTEIQEFIAHR